MLSSSISFASFLGSSLASRQLPSGSSSLGYEFPFSSSDDIHIGFAAAAGVHIFVPLSQLKRPQ